MFSKTISCVKTPTLRIFNHYANRHIHVCLSHNCWLKAVQDWDNAVVHLDQPIAIMLICISRVSAAGHNKLTAAWHQAEFNMSSLVFRKKDFMEQSRLAVLITKFCIKSVCLRGFFWRRGGKRCLTFYILQVYFTSLFWGGGGGGGYTVAHTIHFTKMDFVRLNLSPPRT